MSGIQKTISPFCKLTAIADVIRTQSNSRAEFLSGSDQVERFGRYRVHDVLGRGGFGTVYLGFDDELHRKVAIKVPHDECVKTEQDIALYISEARLVAQLEHDGIASVYDVGRTNDGKCYVVSRFIDGESLAVRVKNSTMTLREAVEIVATVADTLDYVHQQGVVHRDIKPGNILMSQDGRPFVTDFGLALRDHQMSAVSDVTGTPRYMSPEQARGESHLVDGRSDIFSLGILLYRLITGHPPFEGTDITAVLDRIIGSDPRPPREWNSAVSPALQRICLKALSKPISQRYSRARLLAADLREVELRDDTVELSTSETIDDSTRLVASGDRLTGVTPRGLRSFDVGDASFFNKLLPGPHDREGLPESLRFWKSLIECGETEETFRVGVIYGPSGCGKSSLVKAGLLPILDPRVNSVFVEATAEQTEQRMMARLDHSGDGKSTLRDCLRRLRSEPEPGQKTLIVIDQFEQWLHAVADPNHSELANALRQCDGHNVQCIILVRDDFWLAVSRFMSCLDIDLSQNQNMRLVDLFDPIHARRVLAEFGCGYGRLPENLGRLEDAQNEFLDAAIEGLLQHDKIIPVRLALFAEMVKAKPWVRQTLEDLGGIEGVGTKFLEECFESSTAPAEQRVHKVAVHRTLRALLPESGSDIKGSMKSWSELLEESGYSQSPDQFRALIRILDSNLRLVTPTDPMGLSPEDVSGHSGTRFYQLTHDFLVPAIRERLTAEERSSRRGRAEVLLRNFSGAWNEDSSRRVLPGLFEWMQILLWTNRKRWNTTQRRIMSTATRRVVIITTCLVAAIAFAGYAFNRHNGNIRAQALVSQLQTSTVQEVPEILAEMNSYERWTVPRLRTLKETLEPDSSAGLFVSLALFKTDPSQKPYLLKRLLDCSPGEQQLVLAALTPHQREIVPSLREVVADESKDNRARFLAALGLGYFDSDEQLIEDLQPHRDFVSEQIIEAATFDRRAYSSLLVAAKRLSGILQEPLGMVVADRRSDPVRQSTARQLLFDLLNDDSAALANVVLDFEPQHVLRALPQLDKHRTDVAAILTEAVTTGYEDTLTSKEWATRARRQATAAALLLRYRTTLNSWNVFRQSVRPDARSYLIHCVRQLGAPPDLLAARLLKETDNGIRSALLLALGTYDSQTVENLDPEQICDTVQEWYLKESDSSVQAAAGWFLRQWKSPEYVAELDLPDNTSKFSNKQSNWYRDHTGMVMVRLEPTTKNIDPFLISATEVNVTLMRSVLTNYGFEREYAPTNDCSVIAVSWFHAIEFCRGLTLQHGMTDQDQCYEEIEGAERFRLRDDYQSRRGYRLPTQEEWEYSLLGGAESRFEFGDDVSLMPHYEWVSLRRGDMISNPGGLKMPNRLGIFDLNGNLAEWCADTGRQGDRRPIRGGSRGQTLESYDEEPRQTGMIAGTIRFRSVGFRLARSIVDDE